jgi:hypothetical protein
MPHWLQKQPCRRAMSLLKRPILLVLNKAAPPVTCNQCMKLSLQGIHPPLQVVPPTVPSRASTRSKSKNAPQSSLGHVAPFVANLRGQALPRQSTTSLGLRRSMLSPDVEGAPTNNTNNSNKRLPPVRALRQARRPREVPQVSQVPQVPRALRASWAKPREEEGFFRPSSPSHPSKLYSSLGLLNSKVPKSFSPFSLRLIDVDGF